jgi:signal transduction histidine kinase
MEPQPWRAFQPPALLVDVAPPLLLTIFLLAVSPLESRGFAHVHPLDATALLLLAGSALVLVVRRRAAVLAYGASVGLAAAYLGLGHPPGPLYLAPFFGLVAVLARFRPLLWVVAAVLGAGVLTLAHGIAMGWSYPVAIFAGVWLLVALAVGGVLRVRRRFASEVSARMQLVQHSREEEARRRMAEERLRIAREMHDVVGHSLAVISLQAGVAEHLLESRPEEVRRAVAAIREVSKQALADLRVELALLRGNGSQPGERAPAPGLQDLPELVARMRAAGLDAGLESRGEHPNSSDIVASAAYRIVQESLTNVVRHAGPAARAEVRTTATDKALEIEVVDDGAGSSAPDADGDGLAGMRDRALALGGDFSAGNRPGGGFRVWASLPWRS